MSAAALSLIATLQADPRRAVLAIVIAAVIAWAVGRWLGGGSDAAVLAAASAPKTPAAAYTRAQVAEHGSKEDLWVVIDKKVYNLTPYLNEHPGGVEAMMKNAGGDASRGFHGPQHPARVFDIIDDFAVGVLAEE